MTWKSSLFWFVVVVAALATVLAAVGGLPGASWTIIAMVALGAYGARKTVESAGNGQGPTVYADWTSTQLWLSYGILAAATWLASLLIDVNWMGVALTALATMGLRSAVKHRKRAGV